MRMVVSKWVQTYGGPYNDIVGSVVETKEGFTIGGQIGDAFGKYHCWLIETDSLGNQMGDHTYNVEIPIGLMGNIVQTKDEGYAMATFTPQAPQQTGVS